MYAGYDPGYYWLAGIIAATTFFLSIFVQRYMHVLVARWMNVRVIKFKLWMFGASVHLEEVKGPCADFCIAGVGPVSAGIIGGIFIGIAELVLAYSKAETLVYGTLSWIGTSVNYFPRCIVSLNNSC
jgi:hypothetical protein